MVYGRYFSYLMTTIHSSSPMSLLRLTANTAHAADS